MIAIGMLSMAAASCGKETGWEEVVTPISCGPVEITFTTRLGGALLTKAERNVEDWPAGTASGKGISVVSGQYLPFETAGEQTATKTAEVSVISSFDLVCTSGPAGGESEVWALEGTDGYTGKYWPSSDPSYCFYAANIPLAFQEAGCTVEASNDTDVVVAYNPSPTYNSGNSLQFNHIFGRIGSVTVNPDAGFVAADITDVNITVIPHTAGCYNLRLGTWSSVADGPPAVIANTTPGTKSNGLYMVPGSYTLSATWTARGRNYSGSVSVTLVAGQQLNITLALGGRLVHTFAGLEIAPCNAMWDGEKFVIPYDDWNHTSTNEISGLEVGSYFPSFIHAGSFFDSRGDSFRTWSGDIDNNGRRITYGGYDDWRMPTLEELYTLTTGTEPGEPREGAVVNNVEGAKYAILQLTGVLMVNTSEPNGLLLFPDGETISGKALSGMNDDTVTTSVTESEVNHYVAQGCAFLPAVGYKTGAGWYNPQNGGMYWSANASPATNHRGYALKMYIGKYLTLDTYSSWGIDKTSYMTIRPVRDAN